MRQRIKYKLNFDRISFLLKFYQITENKFLEIANCDIKTEKNKLSFEGFKEEINLSVIKKIDKVFNKGLPWYIDKTPIKKNKESSIFFRKDAFNSKLQLEDIKVTYQFEEKKILTQILSKNIEYPIQRKLKKFTIQDNIQKVIKEVNENIQEAKEIDWFDTRKEGSDKKYLKHLCNELEKFGVFIFEYLENHHKKEKVNFNGFYLKNTIVIKRQINLRREIFTLLHEFAHFLLDKEEIDQEVEETKNNDLFKIEKWCNDFAFQFLIDKEKENFNQLKPNEKNNFNEKEIKEITRKTFINPIASYLNFYYNKKISLEIYHEKKEKIKKAYQNQIDEIREKRRQENELKKERDIKPSPAIPKAIKSNLFNELVALNFDNGAISDSEYCNYLGFSKKEKNKFFEDLYQ